LISDPVNDGVLNNPAFDVPTQFTNNP